MNIFFIEKMKRGFKANLVSISITKIHYFRWKNLTLWVKYCFFSPASGHLEKVIRAIPVNNTPLSKNTPPPKCPKYFLGGGILKYSKRWKNTVFWKSRLFKFGRRPKKLEYLRIPPPKCPKIFLRGGILNWNSPDIPPCRCYLKVVHWFSSWKHNGK